MEIEALIDGVLSRAVIPAAAPTEDDYHALWLARDLGSAEPSAMAAWGGALADRLAWVFLAGYQATIRRCFPELPGLRGWSAVVNTEDPAGVLPPAALTDGPEGRRLSGWKTWVAAAAHVERLIVSARHNQLPFVVLHRHQPGMHIDTGTLKSYLPELTQGRARFDDVEVPDALLAGNDRTFPIFRASESAYVRLALNAFIFSHARRLDAPPALTGRALLGMLGCAATVRLPLPSDAAAVAVLGAAEQTGALASEFEAFIQTRDEVLHGRWMADRRLVDGVATGPLTRAAEVLGVTSGLT